MYKLFRIRLLAVIYWLQSFRASQVLLLKADRQLIEKQAAQAQLIGKWLFCLKLVCELL